MKKTICFEIDASEDGTHCGNCQYLEVVPDNNRMWWHCNLFNIRLNTLAFAKVQIANAPGRHKECIKKCK